MAVAVSQQPAAASNDSGQLLARVAREVYHQINYLRDIGASSEAISDSLKAVESDALDASFATVNTELLGVAHDVAFGCRASLTACKDTESILTESIQAFSDIRESFSRLIASTRAIQEVADTIDGFARQTSLLALNARIEAARAGDAGRGFAVVSEEVGKLAEHIKNESVSIQSAVKDISNNVEDAGTLVQTEIDRNKEQEGAVTSMIDTNGQLMRQGERLPEMVEQLDQFLEPLGRAREAVGHNQMIQVAVGNVDRNMQSIYGAMRKATGVKSGVAPDVRSLEGFIDKFAGMLTEGSEPPVESMLDGLLRGGADATDCLDAVGKAVQVANMRQKHCHVSVGDYYLNFLAVERAMQHLEENLPAPRESGMKVVIGNARGDYHSLGREMVGMFLRANGIEVIDVGLGAEVGEFVDATARSGAKVVGVSSLLIESGKEIALIRSALDQRGLRHAKIVAGGACFNIDRDFAQEVGADFVATAASDMVSLVHQVYQHGPFDSESN